MSWMREATDPKKWDAERARFEVPPPGYTGSLEGTVWDDDAVLDTYNQ
jgi:hypothetical protein